jgi:DNA-binding LacI/PurR family transcriptional regulator
LVQTRQGLGSVVLATPSGSPPTGALAFGVNTIAVLVADLDSFYLPLLRGIQDVANERGTLVVIADARDSPRLADAMIRRLIARGVDGIIAVSVGRIPDQPEEGPGRVPVVHVDQPDRRGYSLLFDGHGAGYTATRHLVEHGHDRIGIISAPLIWPTVADVYDGYRRAIEDTGAGSSAAFVSEVPEFTIEAGRVGLARLLDLPDPPTAVFAAGSTFALGALSEARSRGLQVPRDLAIVGYTDISMAELVDPPLTMVEVPVREIGLRAMRLLSDLIDGKRPRRRRTVLDPELIVRESCGSHDVREPGRR